MQVNSEAIGAIAVLQNRSYLPTTTKDFCRTGHEKQEFVCFSNSTPFYDTKQT